MKNKILLCSIAAAVLLPMLFIAWKKIGDTRPAAVVLSYVRPFTFTTQDNKPFTNNDMQGKVCVVSYFFTSCKSICPRMNDNLHKIYDAFKDEPGFMMVSHTCDPEVDSAAVLKHYAGTLKVNTATWVFLTGRKDSLYNQARNSYLLDDPKNGFADINDQFLHTSFVALVNRHGQVCTQIYNSLKEEDMKKLKADIQALLN